MTIYHKTTELYNNTMATLQWSTGSTELQLPTSHYQVHGNSPGFADVVHSQDDVPKPVKKDLNWFHELIYHVWLQFQLPLLEVKELDL